MRAAPPERITAAVITREATCPCSRPFVQTLLGTSPDGGMYLPERCPGCEDELKAEREQADYRRREAERRAALLKQLQVPPLYVQATLESFQLHGDDAHRAKQSRVLQLARRYLGLWSERSDAAALEFPQVVIFRGAPGTGKGHVAWSIAREVVATHGDPVLFVKLSDAIRDLREGWRSDGESEAQRLARYRRAALLIVDEVSAHSLYGAPMQHLYDMVDWRQEQLLPTILTTNETPEGLAALIGPALVSRAAAWGGVIEFGEVDYRPLQRRLRQAGAR